MNRYLRDRLMRSHDERGDEEYMDGRQGVKGTGRYGIGGSRYYGDRERGERDRRYDERSDRNYDSRGRDERRDSYDNRRDRAYDDYDNASDFEYNDMHSKLELDKKILKNWAEDLKNADGTKGPKFDKDKIIPMAKQFGIEFDKKKFTEDEFVMTVNAMYSDYCEALQQSGHPHYSKAEPYIHLAKAFLCDEDFEGKPYEKLALYYYDIVEYDD